MRLRQKAHSAVELVQREREHPLAHDLARALIAFPCSCG
jgi:hypothetical protein